MGTPPEDEAGAGEGVPETAAPPAKSERVNALAARIDAFMSTPGEDAEDAGDGAAPKAPSAGTETADVPIDMDDVEEMEPSQPVQAPIEVAAAPPAAARQTLMYRAIPPPIGARTMPPPPPPRAIPGPPPRPSGMPPIKPPAIPSPVPRHTIPSLSVPPVVAIPPAEPPKDSRETKTKTGELPPPPPPSRTRTGDRGRPPSVPPPLPPATADEELGGVAPDITKMDFGVEVGTGTPNVTVEQPLEAMLEHPTVVDKAIAALGEAGGEQRAEVMAKELEAKVLADPTAAASIAYELGELYERRLADEARAVKAYGRAVNLDPSLRANLWAIRRVFYRRALWPNVAKLVDAEVQYARDDHERADLYLEKARIHAHRMNELDEARAALDEAARIAPQHQGVLLELERVVAKQNDPKALVETWERLADAVDQPARKQSYWLEVARASAAANDLPRAYEAFDKAAQLAAASQVAGAAERIARERLRVAEDRGNADEINKAIDALAELLLAAFGPAGPGAADPTAPAVGERPDRASTLRLELVALRRRQVQLARAAEQPERAWELLQQASALVPGQAIVLADLTELAEELGRYDDLAELVQSWQAVEADPSRALALSIRRADALLRGGQREQARALLASLEAAAPGFAILTSIAERDVLLGMASGSGSVAELAKTYLAAAHAALLGTWLGPGQEVKPEPKAAAALYVQAAELLAYEVATPETPEIYAEARAALGKALEAVPDDPAATEAMIELDDTTGQAADALARLRAAAARDPGDGKRAYIERAIRLARAHGDLETMVELERELIALASGSADSVTLRWRLESTLAQLGREDERAELLVQIAADETDVTGRGTALLAAARVQERAGNVEAATDLYRRVLALWPEDTFARESLIDLLRAQERWPELVKERRDEARSLPDGPAARRALREAAWVLEVRQDDAGAAAAVYDEWLTRFPDDRAAAEGVARCRAAAGDKLGVAHARAAIAEASASSGSIDAQWLHAASLERAGQLDEAAEVFRGLIANEEPSVAATTAALALADLAAARNDTVTRVEATAALALRTSDPRLGAALAEDSGWMYALVLEDFERAAQSFQAAIELEPARRGALLGAALVASKRGDIAQLATAYQGLAGTLQMPDAAAALLLRAAAMAVAQGELDLANERIAAARAAAPDDTSALLVVAETQTTPTVTAEDPFASVDPLLARAEVLEMRGALCDDPVASASWELDRAEALELAGRLREAGNVVASVLKSRPDDLRALSALHRMARRAGDSATTAQAAYALARVLGDRDAKLQLLREATAVFDGPGLPHNSDYAVAALKRIVATDPGAPELDRLLELLRERADVRTLINVLTDRLTWLEADGRGGEEAVPLLLERATVLHGLGDQQAAMADLDSLLEQSRNNVEALRFRADLAINAGDVDTAIALWRRYLAVETRPSRKADIELQLAQVLAENTGDIVGAIEQLGRVVEQNSDDVQLRERLLGLCLRANDWDRAATELRALARMRPTPQDKARDELRLGLMLRDRLNDRVSARMALDRARTLDPLNLDVVRELADLLEPAARGQMLATTAASFRQSIAQNLQNAKTGALYERLAQINAWQADVDARWVSLVAVEALATPAIDQRQVLTQGRAQLGGPQRVKLDDHARAVLRGGHHGPLVELWRAIAPAVQVATGIDAGKLGFGRGDKIAVKKLGDRYGALAASLACFGIDNVDVYISAARAGFARALAAETPILCLGADVAAASGPHQRFLLGRSVMKVAETIAPLPDLREGELEWTLVAALRACDAPIPQALAAAVAGDDTAVLERAKLLKKELPRKAKQVVQQLAQQRAGELADVEGMRARALAAASRAGLVWCGDLAVALQMLDVGRGGRALVDSPAALELCAWSVSEDHLNLRMRLGIALKTGGSR